MDGSANNRAFLKMHFPNYSLATCNFTATSPYNPDQKVIMLMDPSVSVTVTQLFNIQFNLRNNVYKVCSVGGKLQTST